MPPIPELIHHAWGAEYEEVDYFEDAHRFFAQPPPSHDRPVEGD